MLIGIIAAVVRRTTTIGHAGRRRVWPKRAEGRYKGRIEDAERNDAAGQAWSSIQAATAAGLSSRRRPSG